MKIKYSYKNEGDETFDIKLTEKEITRLLGNWIQIDTIEIGSKHVEIIISKDKIKEG